MRWEHARLVVESAYSNYALNAELAIELFGESYSLYQALDDREGMASVQLGLGRAYRTAGSLTLAREALLKGLALYEEIGNVLGQSSALGALSSIAMLQTHFAESERYVRRSLALIQEKDRHQWAYALGLLGSILFHRGAFAEAEDTLQSAINLYRTEGHWMGMANMLRLSENLLHQGKYAESLLQVGEARSLATTITSLPGVREAVNYVYPSRHAAVALALGHYAEAHHYAEQALASWMPVSYARYEWAELTSHLALALWGLGEREDAWLQLSAALKEALQNRTYSGLLLAISTGALFELQRGNVARSLEFYTTIAEQPLVANSVWYADIAGKGIATAASQLPVDVMVSARQSGENADLWETGQRLARLVVCVNLCCNLHLCHREHDNYWRRIHDTLRAMVRRKAGRHKHPTPSCSFNASAGRAKSCAGSVSMVAAQSSPRVLLIRWG